MAYFPFFVDIAGENGLIVGGGSVAAHKVSKLLPFDPILTVVAPEIDEGLWKHSALRCERRPFRDDDIEGKLFVIAATDNEALNAHVSELCRERGILVNVVDDKEKCGFLFPSLVKEGRLTVGISTGGASPQVAVNLRRETQAALPPDTARILDYLETLREPAKERIKDEERRRDFLRDTAGLCMQMGRALTREETEKRFAEYIFR